MGLGGEGRWSEAEEESWSERSRSDLSRSLDFILLSQREPLKLQIWGRRWE